MAIRWSTDTPLPDDYALYLPVNGIHRVRRDLLSASFFQDATRLLSFTFGAAELTGLKIKRDLLRRRLRPLHRRSARGQGRTDCALVKGATPAAAAQL